MLFWKPVRVLLRLRVQAARNGFAESPTPVLWTLLLAGVLALAVLHTGSGLAAQWTRLPISMAETGLQRLWLLMQVFWLLGLLLPGVVTLLSHAPSSLVLRPFVLRPLQMLAAETLAGLVDIPAILALLLTLPLVVHLLSEGSWMQAIVALIAFGLLGIQTGLLARGLAHLGALSARRLRRWAEVPALAVFLLFGLCVGMPPAFASLTGAATPQTHFVSLALPQVSPDKIASLLPSNMAAHAVVAARDADNFGTIGALSQLIVCLGLTGSGALLALRGASRPFVEKLPHAGRPLWTPFSGRSFIAARAAFQAIGVRSGAMLALAAVVVTEGRLLLRAPQNYLRLRKPASLLLLCVFGFLSPNMGRDPVYNLKEFLGLGALLYNVLWQMQFLCNRFGSEAGTGTLLFGFSVSRRTLLMGKNIALFLLLLVLDGLALAGLCVVAGFPQNIPLFWLWLPMILLALTALGNVVSVLHPFSIVPPIKRTSVEPSDTLTGGYIGVGCLAALLLLPAGWLLSFPLFGFISAFVYVAAIYAASLHGASALLARREYQMIAGLDGLGRH